MRKNGKTIDNQIGKDQPHKERPQKNNEGLYIVLVVNMSRGEEILCNESRNHSNRVGRHRRHPYFTYAAGRDVNKRNKNADDAVQNKRLVQPYLRFQKIYHFFHFLTAKQKTI